MYLSRLNNLWYTFHQTRCVADVSHRTPPSPRRELTVEWRVYNKNVGYKSYVKIMLSLAIRSYVTDRVTLSQMQGVHGNV